MPSKLNDSFDKKDYNPDTLAGAYAHRRMEDFVNTIHAASYPHTPEQVGGKVYRHCKRHLDECAKLIGNDSPSDLPTGKRHSCAKKPFTISIIWWRHYPLTITFLQLSRDIWMNLYFSKRLQTSYWPERIWNPSSSLSKRLRSVRIYRQSPNKFYPKA